MPFAYRGIDKSPSRIAKPEGIDTECSKDNI